MFLHKRTTSLIRHKIILKKILLSRTENTLSEFRHKKETCLSQKKALVKMTFFFFLQNKLLSSVSSLMASNFLLCSLHTCCSHTSTWTDSHSGSDPTGWWVEAKLCAWTWRRVLYVLLTQWTGSFWWMEKILRHRILYT